MYTGAVVCHLACTLNRTRYFYQPLRGSVAGWREQDTFIFRVEGTGALPAQDIVATAMDVLIAKLRNLQVRRTLVAPAGLVFSSACII